MDFEYLKWAHYNHFTLYSDRKINQLYLNSSSAVQIQIRMLKYFVKIILSILIALKRVFAPPIPKNRIVFFFVTKNHLDAIKPVYNRLKTKSILLTDNYIFHHSAWVLPLWIPYCISIFYFPYFLWIIMKANRLEKKTLIVFSHQVLLSMGYEDFIRIYLKILNPRAIVFANEHLYQNRMMVQAAEKMGIKCFYIQHSTVYDNVPRLFSSYAMLEGRHAVEKYLDAGSEAKTIVLIGMPKFDRFFRSINRNMIVKRIGICTTRSMDARETGKIIDFIAKEFPGISITLRPHPMNESLIKYQKIIESQKIDVRNSKKIDAFTFLKDVDMVISGNSSILLEAALLNVYAVYYCGKNDDFCYYHDRYDKYDYVKRHVAHPVFDLVSLGNLINRIRFRKPDIRNNAKFYCETVETKDDGQSSRIAAQFIESVIE